LPEHPATLTARDGRSATEGLRDIAGMPPSFYGWKSALSRVTFHGGSRIVYRLSGTGTVGAILRVYIECYESPERRPRRDAQKMFADIIALLRSLAEIEPRTGRKAPSVVT
jgi:hypothetical protein